MLEYEHILEYMPYSYNKQITYYNYYNNMSTKYDEVYSPWQAVQYIQYDMITRYNVLELQPHISCDSSAFILVKKLFGCNPMSNISVWNNLAFSNPSNSTLASNSLS